MANTSEVSSVSDELTVQQEEAVQEQESTMQKREDVQQEKAVQEQENAGQGHEAGQQEPEEQAANMSILAHLTELRRRILYSLLGVAIGSAIAYGFLDRIMAWLVEPAGKLYYMQPAEAFFVYIKVTMFSGFIISLPIIFYQAWAFLLPALTMRERLMMSILVPVSVVLFAAGMLFSFKLVLPVAMSFFLGMGNTDFQPFLSAGSYFDFILTFVLPFGMLFEMPLVMLVLAWMGIVTSDMLAAKFRVVIVVCFVIGALFTPPDVISQSMMAIPMILLYGVGYLAVKYILHK